MKIWIQIFVIGTLAFALTSSNSFAEKGNFPEECKEDRKTLCGDSSSFKEARQCFKEKRSQFSAPCQEVMKARKEKRQAFRESCKADKEKFCTDQKGPGKIIKCLKDNEDSLSPDCQEKISTIDSKNGAKKKSF